METVAAMHPEWDRHLLLVDRYGGSANGGGDLFTTVTEPGRQAWWLGREGRFKVDRSATSRVRVRGVYRAGNTWAQPDVSMRRR
jgi:hypothetical protein